MKLLLLPAALLLAACPAESSIPTVDVEDFRMTFSAAEASASCTDDIRAEADTFEEFSLVYRVHYVDRVEEAEGDEQEVVTNSRVDVYWREQGTNEEDFTYFAAGSVETSAESGILEYAATRLSEERGDNRVYYDIEGRAPLRFGDEVSNGTEDYIITEPAAANGPPLGCVYTLHFDGTRLTSEDPEA